MKIRRQFTVEGRSPYEGIAFRSATSEIRNPDGSVVFSQSEIEVPEEWSQVACDVLAQKYFRKAGVPTALKPVAEDGSAVHGAYVANGCIGCHGATLSGGKIPGAPPAWPPAANLTPGDGSAMARYKTPDQFIGMLRTGHRPDGSAVSSVMPFGSLKEMSEVEMRALYAHLKRLAPVAAGHR